jgi:hypothetical protein
LIKLQEELKEHGIYAYEATGTTEEKLAEMVDRMQVTAVNPEPAPEAKHLLGTLLRRNLLWITLIKAKSACILQWQRNKLTTVQTRPNKPCLPRYIRQALCYPK